MGYSEVHCTICGVSFNIGRVRRADEGQDAAWRAECGPGFATFVPHNKWQGGRCGSHGTCMLAKRKNLDSFQVLEPDDQPGDADSDDPFLDPDYIPVTYDGPVVSEDREPYEMTTPRESESDDSDTPQSESSQDSDRERELESEILYRDFANATLRKPALAPQPEEMLASLPLPEEWREAMDNGLVEHIAGSECEHIGGYSGHHISLSEMRGCVTVQCLVPKPIGWQGEDDDQDFEASYNFFLSGLSDHMPSRDYDRPKAFPVRHGCSSPIADTCFWSEETANQTAMPFHPTCLEVFKRASLQELGLIDIPALTDWYRLEGTYDQFYSFPRSTAVKAGRSQMWEHHKGDQFLAANPCFVPGLAPMLNSAAERGADQSDYHRGAFRISAEYPVPNDRFAGLPAPVRLGILSYLPPASIANLRLASRSFRQIPQSFFHSLLRRKMPWLWETWSSLPYSFWATTTAAELKEKDRQWQEEKELIDRAMRIVTEEYGELEDNHAAAALSALTVQRETESVEARAQHAATLLPAAQTDWFGLYRDITRNWKRLQGLRNRERIWTDCKEILSRIATHRAAGRMGPGIVVDARETLRASFLAAAVRK